MQVFCANGFIGYFASRYHSIQDVITIDTVVLQTSGIELTDGTGLATEGSVGIATVVPDLIETAIGFSFDQAFIVA